MVKKAKKSGFESWANAKVKKMDWMDIGLLKISCVIFGILLVAFFPVVLTVDIWLLIAAVVIFGFKPLYTVYGKK